MILGTTMTYCYRTKFPDNYPITRTAKRSNIYAVIKVWLEVFCTFWMSRLTHVRVVFSHIIYLTITDLAPFKWFKIDRVLFSIATSSHHLALCLTIKKHAFTIPGLVPAQRFPRPSRSIRYDDVSEANGRERPSHLRLDHVTQTALAARNNEA